MNIFGQPREVMDFDYGGIIEDGDTLWFYGARLAKGIAVIGEQHFEWSYLTLQDALIDGVHYGTLVPVDEQQEEIPDKMVILQNYPNPFKPITTIKYEISERSNVVVKVYNTLGQKIITLTDEILSTGIYENKFDGGEINSGVYFAVLTIIQSILFHRLPLELYLTNFIKLYHPK